MDILGTGLGALISLALIGILVYYVKKNTNAERDKQALEAQSSAQDAALTRDEGLLAAREREDREREKIEVVGVDRERANELLRDALKDDLN